MHDVLSCLEVCDYLSQEKGPYLYDPQGHNNCNLMCDGRGTLDEVVSFLIISFKFGF